MGLKRYSALDYAVRIGLLLTDVLIPAAYASDRLGKARGRRLDLLRRFPQASGEEPFFDSVNRDIRIYGKVVEIQERIGEGLFRVEVKRLEGAKFADCIRDAYYAYASQFYGAGLPLTNELLTEIIPRKVFDAAVQHNWVATDSNRVVGEFPEGCGHDRHPGSESVTEQELPEVFGLHKVPAGYGTRFKGLLESRIAFWRDRASARASGGTLPDPAPTVVETAPAPTEPVAVSGAADEAPPLVAPATVAMSKSRGRKRGPKPDYKTAVRVAEIVERVAPNGDWRSKVDDILGELDDARIPTPKTWQPKHRYRNWYAAVAADTAGRGRHMAVEAISYRLKLAKERPPETIP
jgi:hypothetical protein